MNERLLKFMLAVIILGGGYLAWYEYIDGVFVNKVITYTNGVDELNLQTVKKEYKRGEMVQVYTSFCKNREAYAIVQWALYNGKLTIYPERTPKSVPLGCYPQSGGNLVSDIEVIPEDADLGTHIFGGNYKRVLPDGRIITNISRTTSFEVVE